MKLIEKKCSMCGSPIYVYENYAREEMYCTLHCMERATITVSMGLEQLKTVS
jgi:ferredoxin